MQDETAAAASARALSRRQAIGALAAAAGAAAFADKAMAQAPAPAAPPPAPMTGPQVAAPPTNLKAPYPQAGKVNRLDPRLDALIDADAKVEMVCDGFLHAEGPVWVGGANGYLLVSDTQVNDIVKWSPKDGRSVWLSPSGYDAGGVAWNPAIREPGTNGLILGRGGLIVAGSGGRAIFRIDLATKKKTVLVDHYMGKRLNTPNDCVLGPDGSVYFTDPPYGLVNRNAGPDRDLDYMGIFRLSPDNSLHLIDTMTLPNGIGVSPDGTKLYSSDATTGWVMWDLDKKGNASNRRQFAGRDVVAGGDSLKIDAAGNMWAATREGVTIFTPKGERIGFIGSDQGISNCEFGADGYLYIASSTRVLRVKVKAKKLMFKVA
jgi:gluconolactonase